MFYYKQLISRGIAQIGSFGQDRSLWITPQVTHGAMRSDLSWLRESCTVRYPGSGGHAQWGILDNESCTRRYSDPESHAQRGILVRGVMRWQWAACLGAIQWSM